VPVGRGGALKMSQQISLQKTATFAVFGGSEEEECWIRLPLF